MKIIFVALLFFSGVVYAEVYGQLEPGPNATGCKKWSSEGFCGTVDGNYLDAQNFGYVCLAAKGGTSFRVRGYWRTNDLGEREIYRYAVYWKKCEDYEYGTIAPPADPIQEALVGELSANQVYPAMLSNILENDEGNLSIYVIDAEVGGLYVSTWTREGELLNVEATDPETDSLLQETLEGDGISFAPVNL